MYFISLVLLVFIFNQNFAYGYLNCEPEKAISSSKVIKNNARADQDDVLSMAITQFTSMDHLNLSIIFTTSFTSSSTPPATTTTLINYYNNQVAYIIINLIYQENNAEKIRKCKWMVQPVQTDIPRIIQIPDLKYFKEYKIEIGYALRNGKIFERKDTYDIETCFGKPSKPTNLVASLNKDCDLELTWSAPTVLNSPSICYYALDVRTFNNYGRIENLTQTKYIIKNPTPNFMYNLDLEAINHYDCYKDKYPEISNCPTKILGSGVIRTSLETPKKCGITSNSNKFGSSLFNVFMLNIIISLYNRF